MFLVTGVRLLWLITVKDDLPKAILPYQTNLNKMFKVKQNQNC